ncbi:MAG: molybdopterin-binding oxidoreductase, partial [Acidimicrobiia bacterium]
MKDRPGRITGAVAGVVAAGVALGVSELASGVNRRVPPLVAAVADLVIDRAPRAIVESGIAGFGTRTKGVLLVVIVTVSLLVGAALGAVSARPGRRWPVVVGFAGFGLVGVVAGARDPQAWAALGLASAVLAVEAGIGTFVGLLRVLPTAAGTESPDPRAHGLTARLRGRRAFLGLVGAAAMTAAGTAWLGRVLRGRGSVDAARAAVLLPRPDQSAPPPTGASALEVPGLTSLVTPNDRFYRVDIAVLTPQVHPDDWRLRVTGMVDRP